MFGLKLSFRKSAQAPVLNVCKPLKSAFNPAAWNSGSVVDDTNCYTYSLNCPEMGWARPGNLQNRKNACYPDKLITVDNIRRYLIKDGLKEITETQALSGLFYAVALRISDKDDYHFYRQDADGLWSHKLGDSPASRVDENQAAISNPRTAASSAYPDFGGFFTIPEDGVQYVPRLKLPAYLERAFR